MKLKLTLLVLLSVFFLHAQNDYLTYDNLTKKLKELASKNSSVNLKSIGKSSGNKDIWLVTLSESKTPKPALLITAGIDGKHQAGTQIAVKLIEQLLQNKPLYSDKTIYIIPSVSPDAMASFFAKVKVARSGNATPTDDDRDGKIGEDPFEDLNSDGWITQMRIESIDGTHIVSSEDSRLLVKANPSKNQVGKYKLLTEGIDNDKDGKFNEDSSAGVNIDKNFTFDYPAFEAGAGVYVASEPEVRALLDFLYTTPSIYGVVTFGLSNNLSEAPKFDSKLASARIVKGWLENDVKAAEQVSKLYTDKAGIKDGPKTPMTKGNFAQTAYYHAGKFSFSTPGWWIPKEVVKKDSTETKAELPKKGEKEEVNPELQFLKWADKEQVKPVFAEWTTVKHPDFPNQKVEVGGIVPYAMLNPPVSYLEPVVAKHVVFIASLIEAMPKIETTPPLVEKVQNDLFRVTVTVANKGLLPTYASIGDKVRFTSRMKTELKLNKGQTMISGRKIALRDALQADESETYTWLVSGSGKITILTGCATAGIKELIVELK
ncbi:M14 family metallopeptidase [Flavobacterium sp. UBA6135]|uniref:M14 family metallopeptidase n=1 Tax=Flavobacterium sp. UBA6135 TaxID=1946553 RepID=UPI0025B8ADAF|nr:M14 family metallopeptidase [Flavobacterium sp. UBA6135]